MLNSLLLLLFLTSCAAPRIQEPTYSLTLYVSAKHFDYSSAQRCLSTMSKQACDGRFGHAWIALKGSKNGIPISIEGGHSGELGILQPRYFDGVADLVEAGDPNPIRYLWEVQRDGFFQKGAGGHIPTFSAQRAISEEQFDRILAFIKSYSFQEYSLAGKQCTSFAIEVAALAGWHLEGQVTLPIAPVVTFGGVRMRLWRDPRYASLTFYSPDRLEESLRASVANGEAFSLP